jgi:muramoyltetrapeptide carboxypeptidase
MIPDAPSPPSSPSRPPQRPGRLRRGARVALVAPAGPLAADAVDAAEERVRSLGWEPRTGASARLREGFLAGPDDRRLADLQGAFDDPAIDAVWALRGGHGTTRIVDRLDLRRQLVDPIPFIGFSDNTALHLRHAALGVISFHGPHASGDVEPPALDWLHRMLTDPEPAGALHGRAGSGGPVEGRLHGGNLALMSASCGTRDALAVRDRILVLEDVGEPAYRVDRMLVQLDRSGVLEGVAGVACGRFTEGPAGEGVDAVVTAWAEDAGVPVVSGLPFGHVRDHWALPLGCRARLNGDDATLTIVEAAVV